jgi:ribose 5-phosphate isomerase B
MCLGAKIVGSWLAIDLINSFMAAEFVTDPDHVRRVEKLAALEQTN